MKVRCFIIIEVVYWVNGLIRYKSFNDLSDPDFYKLMDVIRIAGLEYNVYRNKKLI